MKNKIPYLIIISSLFLFFISFSFNLFINDLFIINLLTLISKIIFILILLIFFNKFLNIKILNFKRSDLLFIPFILICFCNFYYLIEIKNSFEIIKDNLFIIFLFNVVLTSVSEELLFRGIIQSNLSIQNKFIKILVSSLIFGLFHLVNFFSSFNPMDLVVVVYSFCLGFLLGFIFEYSENNILYVIFFHFLFNFINQFLYGYIKIESNNLLIFYLNAFIVSVIGGIYLLILYFFHFNKKISIEN